VPPMHLAGIDEAGYGPTLGPLTVVAVAVDAADGEALAVAAAALGIADSKEVHCPGDLAPLERVALGGLAWLAGRQPETAAEVFALLGEPASARDQRWMDGAGQLGLPISSDAIEPWNPDGLRPLGVAGAIIQPTAYNRALADGCNKADLELRHVGDLLRWAETRGILEITVDRLGGRRYYRDPLQSVWPAAMVLIEDESPTASRYRVSGGTRDWQVSFRVGADAESPLVGLASCIAKYARELHMHLFNQHWSGTVADLAPTAGYPEDARRWLQAIGDNAIALHGPALIRGFPRF
jgi:ribonuclease HII